MPSLQVRVSPGEVVKLYYAAKVEHFLRHGGLIPGTEVASATADGTGLATFTQPAGIEFYAQRATGALIHLLYSTTKGRAT